MLVDCNSDLCKGGIQCPDDLESGYTLDPNWTNPGGPTVRYAELPLCYSTQGNLCNHTWEMTEIRNHVRDTIVTTSCIDDPILRKCLLDALHGVLAVPIYCKCKPLITDQWGCTFCNGICLDTQKIIDDFGYNINYWAAILLHEMVHWCMGCKFKRRDSQHPIAAASCMKACFPDYGTGSKDGWSEFGGGEHGWPSDWTQANCSICGQQEPGSPPVKRRTAPPSTASSPPDFIPKAP